MGAFEVSHISVWESNSCLALFALIGDYDLTKSLVEERSNVRDFIHKNLLTPSSKLNSNISLTLTDSEAHTLCVQLSLRPTDLIRLKDVKYIFNWNTKDLTTVQEFDSIPLQDLDSKFSARRGIV